MISISYFGSSSSSLNLFFFTQVLTVVSSAFKYNNYYTDKGRNVSIECESDGNALWVKPELNNSKILQTGKILLLRNVTPVDSGLYVCFSLLTDLKSTDSVTNGSSALALNETQNVNQEPLLIDTNSIMSSENEYRLLQKVNLTVRTTPGPVTHLFFKTSTILGFLVWGYDKSLSGGYPIRSFTAEYRCLCGEDLNNNKSIDSTWMLIDPKNIAPNVRQMEIYHLEPNTTYEFRIWANNVLGRGEVVTTNVTTLPEYKEDDLIRLIKPDLDKFDPRVWIIAVSIVFGTFVILTIGLSIVLSKECYQSSIIENEERWQRVEVIPNIIMNPGFSDTDKLAVFTRTVNFDDYYSSEEESDHEPAIDKFKRKVSVFFTGPTIKRL